VKGLFDSRWFGWCSAVIVVGYFIVGFWPFEFRPPNRVSWLAGQSGLHFETFGVAYDPEMLPGFGSNNITGPSANFTVETQLEADGEPGGNLFHILTIHNPQRDLDFILCQWLNHFILRAPSQQPPPSPHPSEVDLTALQAQTPRFVTVRGNGSGTDFFLNGSPTGHYPQFIVKPEALAGQLIIGNDDTGKHPWSGKLFGLALYNRALGPAEIARHYALWSQGHARVLTNAPGLIALYLFNEGNGRIVADISANHHHLVIPEIFCPVHREILIPPWKDMVFMGPDYPDIIVNVLGFVPFGFFFFLYRQCSRPARMAKNILLVVLAGAAISLTIEVVQAWLPNRVSSVMDLLTNTTGALLGAALALAIQSKTAPAKSGLEAR
jgi:glycopeptide antibiotics resistance protein